MFSGSVDDQYLIGCVSSSGHSIRSHALRCRRRSSVLNSGYPLPRDGCAGAASERDGHLLQAVNARMRQVISAPRPRSACLVSTGTSF
jgi:hypothetical protein